MALYGALLEADPDGWRQDSLYLKRDETGWIPPQAEGAALVESLIEAGTAHLPVLMWCARQDMVAYLKGERPGEPTKEDWALHEKALKLFAEIELVGLRGNRRSLKKGDNEESPHRHR